MSLTEIAAPPPDRKAQEAKSDHISLPVLHCYAHEALAGQVRYYFDLTAELRQSAHENGYQPGRVVIEAHGSFNGLTSLTRAALETPGGIAVAVPHLGHLLVLGDPYAWRAFLAQVTGYPVVILHDGP